MFGVVPSMDTDFTAALGSKFFDTKARASAFGAGGCTEAVCSPAMPVDVCAHITGTVWKIETKVGDSVSEGQTLVILESMKMEMPIEAPESGVVAEIAVTEGQAVEEGDVVLRLTPA